VSIQSRSTPPLLADELSDANAHRAEVHQASGMVSIQLAITVDEALARLRAHAFANDQSVAAVAQQIVSRGLRLSDDRPIVGTE
jgi:AmiR/NasT family two-component response regulator